ncbi:hypothetical protein MASR1M68_13850 [Elusimicrobiota bacterium]
MILRSMLVDTEERKKEKTSPPKTKPTDSYIYAFLRPTRCFLKIFLFKNPKIRPVTNATGPIETKANITDDFRDIPFVISVPVKRFMLLIKIKDKIKNSIKIKNNVINLFLLSFLFLIREKI